MVVAEPSMGVRRVPHGGLLYPGEAVFAAHWDPAWAMPLSGRYFFRVVVLEQPQRVVPEELQDVRIAVCLPGRGAGRQQTEAQRELRAVAEARAVYRSRTSPEASALDRALRQQEALLRRRLAQLNVSAYASGSVVTRLHPGFHPHEAFRSGDLDAGVQAIGAALLAWAYPALPIDASAFPRPLAEEDLAALYRGLILGEGTPQERELVASVAPGLFLALPKAPTALNSQSCPVLDSIAEALHNQGETLSRVLIEQLLCHSRGLPDWLVLLYLMAFARGHPESVLLSWEQGMELALRDGTPLREGTVSGFLLRDLPWQPGLLVSFQGVQTAPQPPWAAVAPLAAQLQKHLGQPGTVADEAGLQDLLGQLRTGLDEVRQFVEMLAEVTGQPVSEEAEALLRRLAPVCQTGRWAEFFRASVQLYEGPMALGEDLRRAAQWLQLLPWADQIGATVEYLKGVALGLQQQELALDREVLLRRMQPSSLAAAPQLWPSIHQQFQRFSARYRSTYAAHHARYRRDASALAARLEALRPQVEVLSAFNTLAELGSPVGSDVPGRFGQLRSSLRVCPVTPEELPLETHPVCPSCAISLGQEAPQEAGEQLVAELTAALGEQNRRLGSHAVRQILRSDAALVEKFIAILQASDLDSLATVLDDTVMEFLRAFLAAP